MRKKTTETLISQAFKNPKYAGKHLIVINGQIFATKTGTAQVNLLDKLAKKYPKETPTILYIPKADTLILLLNPQTAKQFVDSSLRAIGGVHKSVNSTD